MHDAAAAFILYKRMIIEDEAIVGGLHAIVKVLLLKGWNFIV